jgi:hypothetical protein
MPETYKSFGTIFGSTATTTIYSGVTGTAIVNSINFANGSLLAGNPVTLEVVKGSTAFLLLYQVPVPLNTTLQGLDSPIVLESNNTLRASMGLTYPMHVFVSVLEVT